MITICADWPALIDSPSASLKEALRLFRKAIELDPNFASAYSFAAVSYTWAKTNGWSSITPNDIVEVKKAAQRAVELGKDDVIALAASGYVQAFVARDLGVGPP